MLYKCIFILKKIFFIFVSYISKQKIFVGSMNQQRKNFKKCRNKLSYQYFIIDHLMLYQLHLKTAVMWVVWMTTVFNAFFRLQNPSITNNGSRKTLKHYQWNSNKFFVTFLNQLFILSIFYYLLNIFLLLSLLRYFRQKKKEEQRTDFKFSICCSTKRFWVFRKKNL